MTDYGTGAIPSWLRAVEKLVVGKDVTHISTYMFELNHVLKSVVFESGTNNVTIGNYAFSGCPIESLEFNGRVSSIGVYAFGYTSLTSIDLKGVTALSSIAFSYCANLEIAENLSVSFTNISDNNVFSNTLISDPVAIIYPSGSGSYIIYPDWKTTWAHVVDGSRIVLCKDLTLTDGLTVSNDITLELNDNKLSATDGPAITVAEGGVLNLTNAGSGGTVSTTGSGSAAIYNKGSIRINANGSFSSASGPVYLNAGGTMRIALAKTYSCGSGYTVLELEGDDAYDGVTANSNNSRLTLPSGYSWYLPSSGQDYQLKKDVTLKWMDGRGNTVDEKTVHYGSVITHPSGEGITKDADAQYTYSFLSW